MREQGKGKTGEIAAAVISLHGYTNKMVEIFPGAVIDDEALLGPSLCQICATLTVAAAISLKCCWTVARLLADGPIPESRPCLTQ